MSSTKFDPQAQQNLLQLFFRLHAKPLIKEAFAEFLTENAVSLVRTKEPSHQLLTSREVAKMLCIDRHTISKMVKRGLPCVYAGSRTRRFRIEDVNAFIETHQS